MTVTKQQQLEWLAFMWTDSWVASTVEYVDMSVLSIGVFCTNTIYPAHRITREEWQQERDNMQKQDNSWHERGELPPVGCECWCCLDDKPVFIVAHHHFINAVVYSSAPGGGELCYGYKGQFRPLRTEREKAIDALIEIILAGGYFTSRDGAASKIAERIYDAGYRKEQAK